MYWNARKGQCLRLPRLVSSMRLNLSYSVDTPPLIVLASASMIRDPGTCICAATRPYNRTASKDVNAML